MFSALCFSCQSAKSQIALSSISGEDPQDNNPEYIIGPEDVLEVSVWKDADLSKTVVVRPDGVITLPLIGEIQAGGHTANKVREMIRMRLVKYKETPVVTVNVAQVNSYNIYILGEVRSPGKYQVRNYITVFQALALAGGFTEWAEKNEMMILRKTQDGQNQRINVGYNEVLRNRKPKLNELLHPGDTLIVP